MKPGFILIDNAEVTQIGNQGETNEVAMKNLKLWTADFLPLCALLRKSRYLKSAFLD
jgi:hypothetical protein